MTIQTEIEARLQKALEPVYLRVENDSRRHKVPPGSETHFSAVIVAEAFARRPLLARHRAVYEALGAQLRDCVHAFTMRTLTPEEWEREQRPERHRPPPCRGEAKAE